MKYYSEDAIHDTLKNTNQNAFDYMDSETKQLNDLIAISYFNRDISYEELKNNIYKYANKLKSYGLRCGDTISLCLPNVPEIVYYKYACWILGVKANLIDPRFNPEGIATFVNQSNSKLLVTVLDAFVPKIEPIMYKLNVENIVIVSPSDSMNYNVSNMLAKASYSYKEKLLNISDKSFKNDKLVLNQSFVKKSENSKIKSIYYDNMDASIVFTSGTTGKPKGAVLTHDAYNIKSRQIKYGVPNIHPSDSFLAIIPFFSAYGSFAGMHNSLTKGMRMEMLPKFDPNAFADLICKYKPSACIGVPKYWEDFEKQFESLKEEYEIEDLSFLKNPVTGGDKIAADVVRKCNELFKKYNSDAHLIVGYGSSETCGPVATTINVNADSNLESTGILFPGIKPLFINPETKEVEPNSTYGELAIHDPAMMNGYLDDTESTSDITIKYNGEKYYKMGDLFELVDDELFFKGRTKRAMMRPDGHTVHAFPIESAIMKSNKVDNCCVVGLKKKDGSSGSIPVAFVLLKDGIIPSEELVQELDNISLRELSERNRALAITFVDSLPYNDMGKVNYKQLEKYFIEDINPYLVDYTFFPNDDLKLKRKK